MVSKCRVGIQEGRREKGPNKDQFVKNYHAQFSFFRGEVWATSGKTILYLVTQHIFVCFNMENHYVCGTFLRVTTGFIIIPKLEWKRNYTRSCIWYLTYGGWYFKHSMARNSANSILSLWDILWLLHDLLKSYQTCQHVPFSYFITLQEILCSKLWQYHGGNDGFMCISPYVYFCQK